MNAMLENFYASFNELKEIYKFELEKQKADKKQYKELERTLKYTDKINGEGVLNINNEIKNEQLKIYDRVNSRVQTISNYKKMLRKFKDIDKFINENF